MSRNHHLNPKLRSRGLRLRGARRETRELTLLGMIVLSLLIQPFSLWTLSTVNRDPSLVYEDPVVSIFLVL